MHLRSCGNLVLSRSPSWIKGSLLLSGSEEKAGVVNGGMGSGGKEGRKEKGKEWGYHHANPLLKTFCRHCLQFRLVSIAESYRIEDQRRLGPCGSGRTS